MGDAMEEQVTGAADWRSETEKRKSLLRKAIIALFKIWIPDHPEASMARGEVFALMRDAFVGIDQICLVSRLSTGVEPRRASTRSSSRATSWRPAAT